MAGEAQRFTMLLTPDRIHDELELIIKQLTELKLRLNKQPFPGVDQDAPSAAFQQAVTYVAGELSYCGEKIQNLARHVSGDIG